MAAAKLIFCSDQVNPSFFTVTVNVFPVAEVDAPVPPITFYTFNKGTPVPASVINDVGTEGGTGPAVVLIIPA